MIKTIKINTKQILDLLQALASLDGKDEIIDGKSIRLPYDISPRTRIDIALNMNELRTRKEAYLTSRNAIVQRLSKGTGMIEPLIVDAQGKSHPNPVHIAWEKEHKTLVDEVFDVKLHALSAKALHIAYNDDPLAKENKIVSGVILELLPILVDMPDSEKVIKAPAK